ncbi:Hepatocyte nuclear factor 1 (HNF-1), partial [Snodgrassella alvi SCGC AB-598-P14]
MIQDHISNQFEQIAIRVFQYQIAGSYIGSVSIMQQQVDTLLNSGVSVETVIRALSMKKGRSLTNDEIGLIKNRYSVMMQKQGSKAKAAKSNAGKGTSAVDDVATITSKDNLSGPTANWNNYTHAEAVIKTGNSGKLANADKAVIDPNKVTSYALNTEHPVGGNKAKVFE